MRERHRLLGIDVLAGLAGVDRVQRVPVVGRGGDDRVDVLAIQQLAIVLQCRTFGFGCGCGCLDPLAVDVAHGHDSCVFGQRDCPARRPAPM